MITILTNNMAAWMKKSQAKRKIGEVRQKAWNDFNKINDVTQNVQFKESPSYWSDVSGSDPEYWRDGKRKALGIGGFSTELTQNLIQNLPIFSETVQSFCHLFNKEITIYVTPKIYFWTKFREIIQGMVITHTSVRSRRNRYPVLTWFVGHNNWISHFGVPQPAVGSVERC